jgi:hypothetical protein
VTSLFRPFLESCDRSSRTHGSRDRRITGILATLPSGERGADFPLAIITTSDYFVADFYIKIGLNRVSVFLTAVERDRTSSQEGMNLTLQQIHPQMVIFQIM